MKIVFVILMIACSNVHAVTSIEWKSENEFNLSLEIKKLVFRAVLANCEVFGNGLREFKTERSVDNDEGYVSYQYGITLSTFVKIGPNFKEVPAVAIGVNGGEWGKEPPSLLWLEGSRDNNNLIFPCLNPPKLKL